MPQIPEVGSEVVVAAISSVWTGLFGVVLRITPADTTFKDNPDLYEVALRPFGQQTGDFNQDFNRQVFRATELTTLTMPGASEHPQQGNQAAAVICATAATNSDDIENVSSVAGATVTAALDTLGEPRIITVMVPAESGVTVTAGNLVLLQSGVITLPSAEVDFADLNTNQSFAIATFLGIAMESSPSGSLREVEIAIQGLFTMRCDSQTFIIGDFVSFAADAGTALVNDKVDKIVSSPNAVAQIVDVPFPAAAVTTAIFRLDSTIFGTTNLG